jgi:hypothetical protein
LQKIFLRNGCDFKSIMAILSQIICMSAIPEEYASS